MGIPNFTVIGNIFEIAGGSTGNVLDETPLTEYRVTFTTNIEPSGLVTYDGNVYKIATVYGGIEADGSLTHATMTEDSALIPDTDPVKLVAANGLSVVNFQYKFQLEKPSWANSVGIVWNAVASFWFDAPISGVTLDLADVVPIAGTERWRGPRADVVSGYFDGDGDLVLVNVDGSYTTPIGPIPDGALVWVDNGDGTWTVG